MIAPLLMWDGPAADVVYLHIKSQAFEYKGVLQGHCRHGPAAADSARRLGQGRSEDGRQE